MTETALAVHETGHLDAPHAHAPVLDFSSGSLRDKWQMAEMLAQSSLVPKEFRGRPGDILIVADLGASLGMSVAQSLQSIASINGRPTMWGDGLIGVVRRSPLCEWIKEEEIGQPDTDGYGYRCSAKRRGEPNVVVNSFTIGDAKRAKLIDKDGPWKLYGPRRMCRMRARSWTLRDAFADVLKGLAMREEIVDVPDEVRTAIVSAPTRTDALKAALGAQAALAAAPGIAIESTDPNAPSPEEQISAVLDAAANADPDFSKLKGVEIKTYVSAEAERAGLKPWELAEIEKATPAGRLVRVNARDVLRTVRERALRADGGIAAPQTRVTPVDVAEETDEVPADDPQVQAAPAQAAPAYATMTTQQLRDLIEDEAARANLSHEQMRDIEKSLPGGKCTRDTIAQMIEAIRSFNAEPAAAAEQGQLL